MRPHVGEALPRQPPGGVGGVQRERGVRHRHLADVRRRGGAGEAAGDEGEEEDQEGEEGKRAVEEEGEERDVREPEEQRRWEKGCLVFFVFVKIFCFLVK